MVTVAAHGDPVLILVALLVGLLIGFTLGFAWNAPDGES